MKFFKSTDLIIIIVLLALAGCAFVAYNFFAQDKEVKAEIYLNSKLMKTISLSDKTEKTFSVQGKGNVLFHLYEDGSIAFEHSDCPDKVCVNSGKLHIAGQSAACLPNGLILKIVSRDGDDKSRNDVVI